jgi:hypothetical protein
MRPYVPQAYPGSDHLIPAMAPVRREAPLPMSNLLPSFIPERPAGR